MEPNSISELNFAVFREVSSLGDIETKGCLLNSQTLRVLETLYIRAAKEKLGTSYPTEVDMIEGYKQCMYSLEATMYFINNLISYHNIALGTVAAHKDTGDVAMMAKATIQAQKEF